MKGVTLLCVFVFVLAASAQNCSNPLITRSGWWGQLTIEPTPIDYTADLSICAAAGIDDAGQSCCSKEFASQLTSTWAQARSEVEKGVDHLKNMNANIKEGIKEAKSEIDNNPSLTQQEKNDLKKMIDSIASFLSEFTDKLPSYFARCANYILKYQAGVACFLCNPNWGQYISEEGQNKLKFRVAQSNCDNFAENCVDMVLLTTKMFRRVMEFAAKMGGSDEESEDFDLFDNCETAAQCKNTICSGQFMTGAGGFMFEDSDSWSDSWEKRSLTMDKLAEVLHPVHQMVVHAIRQQQNEIENVYTSDGYKAMEVGTATGLSTEISSACSISSWLALF